MALGVLGATTMLSGCAWTVISTADAVGSVTQAGFSIASNYSSPTYVNGKPLSVSHVCVEINNSVAVEDLVPALRVALQRSGVDSMVYNAGTSPPDCPAILTYTATLDWGHRAFAEQPTRYLSAIDLKLTHGDQIVVAHYQTEGLNVDRFNSTSSKLSALVHKMIVPAQDPNQTVVVATRSAAYTGAYPGYAPANGGGVYAEPVTMTPAYATALTASPSNPQASGN